MTEPQLIGVVLREANLDEAELNSADLRGADMREASLFDAELVGARLNNVDLRGAKVVYADLQRVAMRMVRMATWTDESVLQRPTSEDRGCHPAGHAQGRGLAHLRGRDLDRQALRLQGSKGGAPGAR